MMYLAHLRSACMACQPRIDTPHALYSLTTHGNNPQTIVHDETDRQYFLELIAHKSVSHHR